MDNNIIDFNSGTPSPGTEPSTPDYHVYAIEVEQPNGDVVTSEVTGYLIVTGAFVGICQGAYSQSEFRFVAPIGRVVSAKALKPASSKSLNS